MHFKIYRFLTNLLGPLIDLYLYRRLKLGKEDPKRFKERLGHASLKRPNGPLIWFHAASVGESLSILPLICAIAAKHKKLNILLTTGTVTSAKLIESRLPDNAFHQYVPVDKPVCVKRFLKHWQPNLAFWVESELWPNLISETAKKCKMILLNARMSENSFKKWQKYKTLSEHMLKAFSLILPQSEADEHRFKELGAKNTVFVGNLKYDAPPLPTDTKKMGELVGKIGMRPVWLASSTHPGEEAIIAITHKQLKETFPELITVIVPRHPNRGVDIAQKIKELSLNPALRSENEVITPETDIYVADTIGELGIFYRLVSIVFIGGSLVPHGGQNPLEAARLDCAILFGPYMDNFSDIRKQMEQESAAIKVKDKADLLQQVDMLLHDHSMVEKLAANAAKLAEEHKNVINSFMQQIEKYLIKIL